MLAGARDSHTPIMLIVSVFSILVGGAVFGRSVVLKFCGLRLSISDSLYLYFA